MSYLFAHSLNVKKVLFDSMIGPYKMLTLWARLDMGAMAIKRYTIFRKAPALLEPYHHIVSCYIRTLMVDGYYPSAEMYSVFSIAQDNWATTVSYNNVNSFRYMLKRLNEYPPST